MGNLNEEEKEIQESLERGEWQTVDNLEEEKERLTSYFQDHHSQDNREITIKIDIDLVEWLNSKSEKGNYHTLINKALRTYISSLEQ